jgi:hypothetical protein
LCRSLCEGSGLGIALIGEGEERQIEEPLGRERRSTSSSLEPSGAVEVPDVGEIG